MEHSLHPMRRKRQALSQEECFDHLEKATSGVLSIVDDAGLPYGIPLNFALDSNQIIFHGALKGRKIDAFRKNPQACFTVVIEETVLPQHLATHYCSIMAFGKIKIVEDEQMKRDYLMTLGRRFLPHDDERITQEIEKMQKATAVFILEIEHLTGKIDKRSLEVQ